MVTIFRGCQMGEEARGLVLIEGREGSSVLIARGEEIARIAILHVKTEEHVSSAMAHFQDPEDFGRLIRYADWLARRARAKRTGE